MDQVDYLDLFKFWPWVEDKILSLTVQFPAAKIKLQSTLLSFSVITCLSIVNKGIQGPLEKFVLHLSATPTKLV